MLEPSRGNDLKDPARLLAGVPKSMPLVTGFEDEIPFLRVHNLIAELRPHASLEDVAILILVCVPVKRSDERPRGDRMLNEGESPAGFLTPNHKPNAKRPEVDSFPVIGSEDTRALRALFHGSPSFFCINEQQNPSSDISKKLNGSASSRL